MTQLEPLLETELAAFFDGSMNDAYSLYDRLRTENPVCRFGGDTFMVTRHADVKAIYRDAERFAQPRTRVIDTPSGAGPLPAAAGGMYREIVDFQQLMISRQNGAEHRRYRGAANRAFLPKRIDELHVLIEEIVDDVLDSLVDSVPVNFMEFAYRVPLLVIMELLGAPRADADRVKQWGDAFLEFSVSAPHDAEHVRNGHHQLEEYRAYADELIARNRDARSQTNLVSLLLDAERDDRLEYDELVATFMHLLLAGHETTTNLLGNGLAALLVNRDQWELMREDPSLVARTVDEILRYDPPVQVIVKSAAQTTEVRGVEIPAGSTVVLCQAAANRDPDVFAEPDSFDIIREPNDHLSLGFGTHFCLGAPLARLEGRIALHRIAERFPALRLATDVDSLEWVGLPHFRALTALPVSLGLG
jgi:cytochrome P450